MALTTVLPVAALSLPLLANSQYIICFDKQLITAGQIWYSMVHSPRIEVLNRNLNHIFHKFCQRQFNINGGLWSVSIKCLKLSISPSFINGLEVSSALVQSGRYSAKNQTWWKIGIIVSWNSKGREFLQESSSLNQKCATHALREHLGSLKPLLSVWNGQTDKILSS